MTQQSAKVDEALEGGNGASQLPWRNDARAVLRCEKFGPREKFDLYTPILELIGFSELRDRISRKTAEDYKGRMKLVRDVGVL